MTAIAPRTLDRAGPAISPRSEEPRDYSVFSASAGAVLLRLWSSLPRLSAGDGMALGIRI